MARFDDIDDIMENSAPLSTFERKCRGTDGRHDIFNGDATGVSVEITLYLAQDGYRWVAIPSKCPYLYRRTEDSHVEYHCKIASPGSDNHASAPCCQFGKNPHYSPRGDC